MKAIRKSACMFALAMAAIAAAISTRAESPPHIASTRMPVECAPSAQPAFDLAFALLRAHVFPLAARAFDDVLRRDAACAMGHWGTAIAIMGDPRTTGPSPQQLAQGAEAIARAKAIGGKTEQECELIEAVAEYYHRHRERDHATRVLRYQASLRRALERFPRDQELREFHDEAFDALARH